MSREDGRTKLQSDPSDARRVYEELCRRGYHESPMQLPEGQEFGLVYDLSNNKQVQVRMYQDGVIDSEIEPSRVSTAHLLSLFSGEEPDYSSEIARILDDAGIPYQSIGELRSEPVSHRVSGGMHLRWIAVVPGALIAGFAAIRFIQARYNRRS